MSTASNISALESVLPLKAAFGYVGQRPSAERALGSLRSQFGQLNAANDPSAPSTLDAGLVALTVERITSIIRDPELSTDDALDMMKAMAESQPALFEATSRPICQELESRGYDFHARTLAGVMAKKGVHIDLVNQISLDVLGR